MKAAVHRTEIKRLFLATKGYNINLIHFLLPYHVIINNVHIYFFTGTIFYVHRRAPKTVLYARNFVYKKLQFMKTW